MISQDEEYPNEESIKMALTRYSIVNNNIGDQSKKVNKNQEINQWTDSYRKINQPSESNMNSIISDKEKLQTEYNEEPTLPKVISNDTTPKLNEFSVV